MTWSFVCVCDSIQRNPRWHGGGGRFWCADSDQIFIWIKLKSFKTFFHWKVQQIQITSPGPVSNTTTVASKMQIVCSVQKCKWPDIWSRAKDIYSFTEWWIQCKWQWLSIQQTYWHLAQLWFQNFWGNWITISNLQHKFLPERFISKWTLHITLQRQ